MTRRGSLIYYLTAWICGCFFMSLAIWIRDFWGSTVTSPRSREAFGILFFYFYGLVFGGLAVLIAAFLLRRIMTLLKCKTPLHWAAAAAILAPVLVAALGNWEPACKRDSRSSLACFRFCSTVQRWYFRRMVAGNSGRCRDGIFTVPRAARVRRGAARCACG